MKENKQNLLPVDGQKVGIKRFPEQKGNNERSNIELKKEHDKQKIQKTFCLDYFSFSQ